MQNLKTIAARPSAGSAEPADATASGYLPLFPVAWLFAVGIALTHWILLNASFVLLAAVGLAVLCTVAAFAAPRVAWLPLAFLWLLLGNWCALMEPQPAPSSALLPFANGLLRTVTGTVVDGSPVRIEADDPVREDDLAAAPVTIQRPTQRLDVELSTIEQVNDTEDRELPTTGRIRVLVRWPEGAPLPFRCGDQIRAALRIDRPVDYRDPGAWSRAAYLLDAGITATAATSADRLVRIASHSHFHPGCMLRNLQHGAATQLLRLPAAMPWLPAPLRISADDAVMLAAMVTGDRTYLRHSLRVGFERTGSFHMLVVSGFHLAILAACLQALLRPLRLGRVASTIAILAVSFAYALFTGFGIPVERAFWMVTLYLLGRLLYRERSALNAMGLAALCLLTASPRSLFDASLQMTLLAVVAIGGLAAPLLAGTLHPYVRATQQLPVRALDLGLAPHIAQFRVLLRIFAERLTVCAGRWLGWRVLPFLVRFWVRLAELLAVSAIVELAMTLPMAIFFHRITLYALPINMLMLPLLFVLLPAALITLATLALWPAAAAIPGAVTALALHLGVRLVHLFGATHTGDLRIPTPLLAQQIAFYALLLLAVWMARHALLRASKRRRWTSIGAVVAAALVVLLPRSADHPRNGLLVEAIDVGQGDAILLIAPSGASMLVDAGGFGGSPQQAHEEFDIGEEVVAPALWARGLRTLDVVALSHAHSDHMGGMPAILRDFHPRELWVGNNPPVASYRALLREAAELHIAVHSLRQGDERLLGEDRVRVLAPLQDYQPGAEPQNNDSLVLQVAHGSSAVLLEGDAEAPIESALLAEPGLESALLKVGHHGSKTSSTPAFLNRVHPQMAIISCGLHNRYGHPAPQTLFRLQAMGVRTFSTDLAGAACFVLDGRAVQLDAGCKAHP